MCHRQGNAWRQDCPADPLKWKSQKQDRAVSSTLAAELYTVSKNRSSMDKAVFLEIWNSEYSLDNIEQLPHQVVVIAVIYRQHTIV